MPKFVKKPRLRPFPKRLIGLVKRYRQEPNVEDCGDIGLVLAEYIVAVRQQKSAPKKCRQKTIVKVVEWLKKQGVFLHESTAYDCMRLSKRFASSRLPDLRKLGLTVALELAAVKDDADRDRLATRAVEEKWTARQAAREVLEVKGYRRRSAEPENEAQSNSEPPGGEGPRAWQPALYPRVELRELVRLAGRATRAAEAWVKPGSNRKPVLDAFRTKYRAISTKDGQPVISKSGYTELKSRLEAFLTAAKELEASLTKIDAALADAEKQELSTGSPAKAR